ncbi:MAG TPA: hypothetical protein VGL99_31110 [Chloroflexota bacterium]|jgi:hypothetical protein
MQRVLWQTLIELADAARPVGRAADQLRVTSLTLDLPIELAMARSSTGIEILADLPRWRWPTDFDPPLGRLRVVLTQLDETTP